MVFRTPLLSRSEAFLFLAGTPAAGTPVARRRDSCRSLQELLPLVGRCFHSRLPSIAAGTPASRCQHSRCSSQALLLLAAGTPTAGTHSRMLDISQTSAVLSSGSPPSFYFHAPLELASDDLAGCFG
ncbi:hypothetical protein Scep_001808 [Stephania cephalantha]|uniref:Uncharacterized protein n=1 Tax=Stephania cephalantha TaxID=152367 RepID=A0AAP0L8Q1_9MAGN